MKHILIAAIAAIAISTSSATADNLVVDNTFLTQGFGEFEADGKTRYAGMFAYKLFETKGTAALCGTVASFQPSKRDKYLRRALPGASVFLDQKRIRNGVGYMPNVVLKGVTPTLGDLSGMRPDEMQTLFEKFRIQNSLPDVRVNRLMGQPVKCKRTKLKWSPNLGKTKLNISLPNTVHYTVRR